MDKFKLTSQDPEDYKDIYETILNEYGESIVPLVITEFMRSRDLVQLTATMKHGKPNRAVEIRLTSGFVVVIDDEKVDELDE